MEKLWLFQFTRFLVWAFCRLYFRIEFEGAERVPIEGAVIVAPNHVSYLDPFWVSIPIKRPLRYMTWDRITLLPLLGPLIRAYGAFPVNLEAGDRAAFRRSLEQLRSGGGLVIFPEGARTRTGRMTTFKPGVIRLALAGDVSIVPVTIIGGYRAFSPHHFFPRPYKLKVVYHNPIKPSSPREASRIKEYARAQADCLQSIVASALSADELPESDTLMIKTSSSNPDRAT
jgi:1-acyl-sn-glycerol-3-phosphate acyltransferase